MNVPRLDHCVIAVSDWDASTRFYCDVMRAEAVGEPPRAAFRFGDTQLNVHGPGGEPFPLARIPVRPGNSDLCFVWRGPIDDAISHLERHDVAIEEGPIERRGARGVGTSVYFRDPDGTLLEFISYG